MGLSHAIASERARLTRLADSVLESDQGTGNYSKSILDVVIQDVEKNELAGAPVLLPP